MTTPRGGRRSQLARAKTDEAEHAAWLRALPDDVRERLMRLAGSKLTRDGELVIIAQRHRTQVRNR